jgi:acrylyl-CoA reductase (NADPH)
VHAPTTQRTEAWTRLARDLDLDKLEQVTTVIVLAEAFDAAADVLSAHVRGRIVLDLNSRS